MRSFRKAFQSNRHKLMQKPNVVGVGLGYKQINGEQTKDQALLVLVQKKLPRNRLKTHDLVPQQVDGHPTDVIETGIIRLLAARTGSLRPAQPGCSIGHYKVTAGTLGAVVRDKKSKEVLLLSNNHVLANSTDGTDDQAEPGDKILQPGPSDGGSIERDVIAYLHRYAPIHKDLALTTCKYAGILQKTINQLLKKILPTYRFALYKHNNMNNLVDAACARPRDEKDLDKKIMELGYVQGLAEVNSGSTVMFSGRTSGVRSGKVIAVDTSIRVELDHHSSAVFEDQIIAEGISAPGDSGSLLLNEDNMAVGLLFAGSPQVTACNRIDKVLQILDIELEY